MLLQFLCVDRWHARSKPTTFSLSQSVPDPLGSFVSVPLRNMNITITDVPNSPCRAEIHKLYPHSHIPSSMTEDKLIVPSKKTIDDL
jgi:hypothetical protein